MSDKKTVYNPLIGEHEEGDVGADRRKIFLNEMAKAMDVCNRPSFGKPKPYRAIYADGRIVDLGIIKIKDWVREQPEEELPDLIEKLWPEVGWEPLWTRSLGWI